MSAEPLPEGTCRARLSAAERREALLAAARRVFARRGYHAAGTAEIARVCGCSEPVLYKHFASKRQLFAAVIECTAGMGLPAAADAGQSDDPLEELVRASERLYADPAYAEIVRLRLLALTMADEPEIAEALGRSAWRLRQKVRAAVGRAHELGQVRADVDPDAVAELWLSVVFGGAVRHALGGPAALRTVPGHLRSLVHMIASERT